MADSNGSELCALGDRMFSRKSQLDELWQSLAEEFFPERADFTTDRIEGDEYADRMYSSIPAQNRRDLSGAIGAILRPRGKAWFRPRPKEDWRRTDQAMAFADYARDVIRNMLYSERSLFQRVMADADDDFVSFGNAVPVITENETRNGFLFEMSHLRDNAWQHNRYQVVDVNHRKIKMTLRNIAQRWGVKSLTSSQLTLLEKAPHTEIEIRHVCMPTKDYDFFYNAKKFRKFPFTSVYINPEGRTILHEGGYWEFPYKHRRWKLGYNSVYGYSPAAMLGLIDARVLQAQERIILDSGELQIAPPLMAKRDAVFGGINNYAGAVTWIDTEYDERFGDAIRSFNNEADVRLGLEMKVDTRNVLAAAWYLNKLNLPSDKEMTAFEVNERISEYIRSAGPIFEPFEADNAMILDHIFEMGLRLGYFGDIASIPPELRGGEIEWEFDTPIQQAYERQRVARAQETAMYVGQIIQPLAQVDPEKAQEVAKQFDWVKIARDGAESIGGESEWRRPLEVVGQELQAQREQMAKAQQMQEANAQLEMLDKGAGAAGKVGMDLNNPIIQGQLQQLLGGQGQGGSAGDLSADYPVIEGDEFGFDVDVSDIAEGLDEEDMFADLEEIGNQ